MGFRGFRTVRQPSAKRSSSGLLRQRGTQWEPRPPGTAQCFRRLRHEVAAVSGSEIGCNSLARSANETNSTCLGTSSACAPSGQLSGSPMTRPSLVNDRLSGTKAAALECGQPGARSSSSAILRLGDGRFGPGKAGQQGHILLRVLSCPFSGEDFHGGRGLLRSPPPGRVHCGGPPRYLASNSTRKHERSDPDRPADGITASVEYRAEHAPALARAILEAVGLDPRTVFLGELPDLKS